MTTNEFATKSDIYSLDAKIQILETNLKHVERTVNLTLMIALGGLFANVGVLVTFLSVLLTKIL